MRLPAPLALLLVLVLGCAPPAPPTTPLPEPDEEATPIPGPDRRPAPSFDGGAAWLNTDRPLSLEALRGHVVLVDFWTYCCINCLHTLPELARLERHFADQPVVVLGVHSGKFDAEQDASRIAAAMQRHDVRHPVVVDPDFTIWKRWGVKAWPTLALVDPEGRVVAMEGGEPDGEVVERVVERVLAEAKAKGTLAEERIAIEAPPPPRTGPLAFPGKVAVSPTGDVAVADSGHHRVVVADGEGSVKAVVGSGIEGARDGPLLRAAFRYPQGIAFDDTGRRLFVADTENHQIRVIDLEKGTVTTVAGTGEKGRPSAGGAARETALRSPWDLAFDDGRLFVAMAGAHQLWELHLAEGTARPLAGSGRENIDDGALLEATFSQPSGLALDGDRLFVADSEVSAVRLVDLARGRVETLVGTGLFDFGDVDGVGEEVRLQHALGIALRGEQLFVADTFNDKLKRLDPTTRSVTTVAGGDGTLSEPGGLALLSDGRLLIADTNHHRVASFDPTTASLDDFPLAGLTAPAIAGWVVAPGATGVTSADEMPTIEATAEGTLGVGRNTLHLELLAPPDGELTEGAPAVAEVTAIEGATAPNLRVRQAIGEGSLTLEIPLQVKTPGDVHAQIDAHWFWCNEGDAAACNPVAARLRVTMKAGAGAPGVVRVAVEPTP